MSKALHAAIHDALRDSKAYAERGILVSPLLEATCDLHASDDVLYRAVYTLVCAMPWRLVPGSTFLITTIDMPGGAELAWDAREEPTQGADDLRMSLRAGPHGDLVSIAFSALERFCDARAGEIATSLALIAASPRFPRGMALQRRVRIFLPASRADGLAQKALRAEA